MYLVMFYKDVDRYGYLLTFYLRFLHDCERLKQLKTSAADAASCSSDSRCGIRRGRTSFEEGRPSGCHYESGCRSCRSKYWLCVSVLPGQTRDLRRLAPAAHRRN